MRRDPEPWPSEIVGPAVVLGLILFLLTQLCSAGMGQARIKVAILGDSQWYTATYPRHFEPMVLDAIAQGPNAVVHVGDVTQHGDQISEWLVAYQAMRHLAGLPVVIAIGNHDYPRGRKGPAPLFNAFAGPVLQGKLFSGPGGPWVLVALEWWPADHQLEQLCWAMDAMPWIPFVIVTHEWLLYDHPTSSSPSAPLHRSPRGSRLDNVGDNSAVQTWAKLQTYPNLVAILSGHKNGAEQRLSTSILGLPVLEILTNFQLEPEGGQGFWRLLELDGTTATITTRSATYTPGPNRINWAGTVQLPFDTNARQAWLAAHQVVHLPPAGDGYVIEAWAGSVRGTGDYVWADGNQAGEVGWLRFDVSPFAGMTLVQAVLTVTTEGHDANTTTGAALHALDRPVSELDSWTSLGGLAPGAGAQATPDAVLGPVPRGTQSIDVTARVRRWLAGEPAHGWAVFGTDDAWKFRSREWPRPERPELTLVLRR